MLMSNFPLLDTTLFPVILPSPHFPPLHSCNSSKRQAPQMLWRARVTVQLRSLRVNSSHFSAKPDLHFHPESKVDKDCVNFLPWLEKKAGVEISSNLYIGKSAHGRSLFASRRIQAGDCILKVPHNVQMSSDTLFPLLKTSLCDEVGNDSKLALVLLVEWKIRQEESGWAPYISCLPQPGDMHSTIFWSESELDMIRQSSLYQETIKVKAQLEKDFRTFEQALQDFPGILESFTLKDFMHAYASVTSRAWGSTNGISLIPFADFLNHNGLTEALLINDEDKQLHEVIADRDYAPHEEVLIRYGKFSNASLLLDYGFTLPYNIHDEVHFQIKIPHRHFLSGTKLQILPRHLPPSTINSNGIKFSGDSFIIKEVRPISRKGKGLPQSLRAFARVLSCNSPQDLSDLAVEAAQHDGRIARRPFEDQSREIVAHEILSSQINELIEGYNASIESLGHINPYSMRKTFILRRQMALHLLKGELRVLKSVSSWLKNYCATLKWHVATNITTGADGAFGNEGEGKGK